MAGAALVVGSFVDVFGNHGVLTRFVAKDMVIVEVDGIEYRVDVANCWARSGSTSGPYNRELARGTGPQPVRA